MRRLFEAGVEFVHGDVRNVEDIAKTGEVDLIVEAAAETSVLAGVDSDPGYVVRSNLVGTVNCLEFARRHGAAFIFLSTSRVYPIERLRQFDLRIEGERFEMVDPHESRGVTEKGVSERFPLEGERTLYGATKLAAELIAGEFFGMYGIPGVINRCGVIAGPWQMARVDQGVVGLWCSRHLFGGTLSYIGYGGYQVRDVLHVDDLVELIVRQVRSVKRHSGAVFNVGGGREVSFSLRELTALCVGPSRSPDSDRYRFRAPSGRRAAVPFGRLARARDLRLASTARPRGYSRRYDAMARRARRPSSGGVRNMKAAQTGSQTGGPTIGNHRAVRSADDLLAAKDVDPSRRNRSPRRGFVPSKLNHSRSS